MLLVYSVWEGEWIHTQVTNKSYAISFAISFVAGWGSIPNLVETCHHVLNQGWFSLLLKAVAQRKHTGLKPFTQVHL